MRAINGVHKEELVQTAIDQVSISHVAEVGVM